MAGLVLLVQNATDRFDTWAYAWTLVVLVGPGIGRWLAGIVRGRGDLAASGGWLVAAGLVAFLVLAVFFEVVIGIGGRPFGSAGRYGLAALLIVAGLILLGRRLLAARRP
jgi:ABC-type antimicrobial peptide transport system permease subunit